MNDISRKYKDFIGKVHKYGVSLNNNFSVTYKFSSQELISKITRNLNKSDIKSAEEHLSFFVENVEIPPTFLATGDYKYGNSPQFKYPYAQIFNAVNITYILDGSCIQRQFFDSWLDYIYNLSNNSRSLRIPYKNDYCCTEILISKYDRCASSSGANTPSEVIENNGKVKYSATMINAFPTNVSAIPLSNAASDLTRCTVTFEYDLLRTSTNYGGSSQSQNSTNYFNP